MNKKLRKLMRKLENSGAMVGMADDMPDDVAEMFIHSIMSCPDCVAAMKNSEEQPKGIKRRDEH